MSENMENFSGFMVPRADFKGEQFDTLIQQKGYRVLWQQGMFCSCYIAESGQPDYNCSTCKGKGYIYFGDSETRALVTSINGRKEQEHIGLQDLGSAYLTPLSSDNVGFRDRFVFLDFTMKYSEIVTHTGSVDPLRYPVIELIAIRKLDDEIRRGVDLNLSVDGKSLEWITHNLEIGDKYSVLYTTRPVYIAINPIHELRGSYTMLKGGGLERFVKLPNQYQIKREDFIENERVY
jgi:hypothetical protein